MARVEGDYGLAGADSDSHSKMKIRVRRVQIGDGVDDCETAPHSTVRVIAVRSRRTEDRDHGIADEFLCRSSVAPDLVADGNEKPSQSIANVLWINPMRVGRRAHQVGKENRHQLALVAAVSARGERCPASHAEPCVGRVVRQTSFALAHGREHIPYSPPL